MFAKNGFSPWSLTAAAALQEVPPPRVRGLTLQLTALGDCLATDQKESLAARILFNGLEEVSEPPLS
jgi:hypothetical protein